MAPADTRLLALADEIPGVKHWDVNEAGVLQAFVEYEDSDMDYLVTIWLDEDTFGASIDDRNIGELQTVNFPASLDLDMQVQEILDRIVTCMPAGEVDEHA